jgi:NAD dependent epimerase/dehydratase
MDNQILITGADGFIGSHLTESFLERGYKVKALSNYNSFNNYGWLEDIKNKNLEVVVGDIRDPFYCLDLVKNVSIIYNLAALIAVPFSYISPGSYIQTNAIGTYNICEAAKRNGNIRLVQISTSEVYGTAKYLPIDEKHPKNPQSPYSASKIGADAIALSYFNSYDLPVIIARPFNTYGPRQSYRAVIPSIILQILSGNDKVVLGDTSTKRDFNYVNDICEGLISLGQTNNANGCEVNICSNSSQTIEQIFCQIRKIMQVQVELDFKKELVRPAKSEVLELQGDYSQLFKLTGWKPKVSLEEGLITTCKWYQKPENLKKFKIVLNSF